MSVDKFGRYSSVYNAPSSLGLRGPKGEGFNLTKNGDYDIQFKRICNIGMPTENGDAVNKKYFNDNSLIKLPNSYSVHQFKIQDVSYPEYDGDAVNYKFLKENTLVVDKDCFNAKKLRISNVENPKIGQDVVNLRYLQLNTLMLKDNKEFDASGRVIKNLGKPKRTNDAISYLFVADVLAEMSFAIYNNLRNKSKQKITKEEWKKKVVKSLYNTDWSGLFGTSENDLVQPLNDESKPNLINKDEIKVNNQ